MSNGMKTVLIGLGSNLGDRMGYLTRAFKCLIKKKILCAPIRSSRVYTSAALLPDHAESSWSQNFLNAVLEARTNLDPRTLLAELKKIERELGRDDAERWAPRKIDLDILWMEDVHMAEPDLHLPHSALLFRSFWLKPLFELRSRLPMHGGLVEIEPLARELLEPQAHPLPCSLLPAELVGIVNVTPDSFSDGGLYDDSIAAFRRIRELVEEGAHVIDIGAESTRPGAISLTNDVEWLRLEPILSELKRGLRTEYPWVKWSLDTRHPETVEKLADYPVDWINDVTGGDSSRMMDAWVASNHDLVFMHHMGVPVDPAVHLPKEEDAILNILKWAADKRVQFESRGISCDRMILDPGIGFGKLPEQSLEILRRLNELKDLGLRLLIGHSRKSFLTLVTNEPAIRRDLETHVISANLISRGVDYLRIHDVKGCARAIRAQLMIGH